MIERNDAVDIWMLGGIKMESIVNWFKQTPEIWKRSLCAWIGILEKSMP